MIEFGLLHSPARPGWWCEICYADWPCSPAKVQLAEVYRHDFPALRLFLGRQMWNAIEDATHAYRSAPRTRNMHERFIDWSDSLTEKTGRDR